MLKTFAAIAGATLMIGVAQVSAADLYVPQEAPELPSFGGWYLRGDIGMSNQRLDRLHYEYMSDPVEFGWRDKGDFDSAPIYSVGIGYQFNDWLRGDLTAQYRGKASFSALDYYDTDGIAGTGDEGTNSYTAKKSEWLFLANAYADFKNSTIFTPYLGVGVGASRNTISNFRDINVVQGGGGYAGTDSQWNFAWALHAGLGIQATDRLTFDLGYSYVDLGNATTGTAYNDIPGQSRPNDGFKFKDITSHDLKLGMRYAFN